MNVLLTTSAAPGEAPFSTTEKRMPIGIGFLISVLRNKGHKVYFIDNYLQPSDFLQTDYLRRNQIDFVGIYVNTICYRDTRKMLDMLEHLRHTNKWNGKIIVGGPHTTVAVHTIPGFVDYVVQGEGERAIVDIVEGKIHNRIVRYPRIENLDELPPPAWDYFAKLPYNWTVPWSEQGPVFTMNTSRGCPFNCAFCSVQSVWGKKYTCFSAERIVSDIEHLIKNYGIKGIYFREDNFTLNKERVIKFCNLIIEKGIKISWVCESRVSNLTRDIVELMSRTGLKGFYFGVESGSQRLLDLLQKGITVEQIKNAFKWCREFNVNTAASIIVGVPGETEADRRQTSRLLKEIKPTIIWPNIFVGIPDSHLYRFVLNNKLYQYIDDRGLAYLQGHNNKVKHYYGSDSNAYIPDDESKKDMTTRPKISVLMAVYNGEKFIEQALKSIYNQTCQDFEVIIVDDASTDRTSDILVKMKDSRTFIYRNSENKGLTKSLNIALKLCRGEYIARMDADDISCPERFEKQVKFLDENPNCVALGSWYGRIDANGRIWGSKQNPTKYEDIKKKLLIGNCIGHGSAMLRRSSLLELGGYNEKYTYAQDYDLWLRLSEVGQVRNLGEYLYHLRSWPGTISATRAKQQNEYAGLALQEALKRRLNTKPIDQQTPCRFVDRAFAQFGNSKYTSCNITQTKKPVVSVIIPAYNAAKYIAEAIKSVLIQNYSNFELVIVDDGSTDQTKDIVHSFKDERIKYFYQENAGLAATYNEGIRKSKGDFLIKLDHDDMIAQDFIAGHIQEFEKCPDADLVYCDDLLIDEDGKPIRVIERPEYTDRKSLIRDLFRCGFPVVPFRTCIRRNVFDKIGLFDEDLRMAEDYDMIRRFVKHSLKTHHLKTALYLRRMTPDSLSRNFTAEKAKLHFEVVKRFTDTFTYDELFPDVDWNKIAPEMRQLHAKCLNAVTYLAIGGAYVKSNAPLYAQTAFEQACLQLKDCLKADPANPRIHRLLQKCEFARARYTQASQQPVC